MAWATAAPDAVHRGVRNQLRAAGDTATAIKGSRWALLKNPPDLTGNQKTTLASIAKLNNPLYRAYLLTEQLRAAFEAKGARGRALLAGWLAWARRCRIPEFVALAKTIKRFLPLIRGHPRPRSGQRPVRGHQHPPTATHPPRLRLPQPRRPDRHGHPHPRRPLPTPPRTIMKIDPRKQQ